MSAEVKIVLTDQEIIDCLLEEAEYWAKHNQTSGYGAAANMIAYLTVPYFYKGRPPSTRDERHPKNPDLTRKEREENVKIRIDPLDTLVSKYVRLRDKHICQRCHHPGNIVACAHFHGRGKKTVRYDPDNCTSLCYGCHSFLDGRPVEKIEFFRQLLGEKKFNELNYRAMQTHPKPDKAAIKIYLQEQIKSLEVTNG